MNLPPPKPRMGSRSLYLNLDNLDRLTALLARFNAEERPANPLTVSQLIDFEIAEQIEKWERSFAADGGGK